MTSEARQAREKTWTLVMCRLLLVLYGVVLALVVWTLMDDPTIRSASYAAIVVVFALGLRSSRARYLIRVVSAVHLFLVILLFRVIVTEIDQALFLLITSLTIPVGAVLFIREPTEPARDLDLPPGYEMSFARDRVMSTGQRLVMWIGFSLVLPLVLVGGPALLLVVSIVLVPIGIGLYFLWETVISRRRTRPRGPRRLSLHPRMRKPVQQRSHWSVGPSPYEDERIYED